MKNGHLALCLLLVLSLCACQQPANKEKQPDTATTDQDTRPNIIVIVIDDAGYVDFGFAGSEDLETPNIDRLAQNGVVFTDAHVSATVCAPSRAGLMTGQYQQRFGFEANGTGYGSSGDIGLADDVTTMADVFQRNDYKTIAIGKWHLGGTPSDHPNARGFDEFYGFSGGGRSYFPIQKPSKGEMLQQNGKQVNFDGYLTDVLGDRSVSFTEENKDKPFFMYLAYNAVHTPMEAKEEHLKKFEGHPRQTLAAMTWSLDENIGKLRSKLEELSLLDNTLIYFISDNGGAHNNSSKHGELKGWKGNEFEAGHRVPFIVSWPSRIPMNRAFHGLTSSLDIFATSMAAADITKEATMTLDGVDLLPYLTEDKFGSPHEALFWRKLEESAARVGSNKIVQLEGYGATLYDLEKDPGEKNDLSAQSPEIQHQLQKRFQEWEAKMIDPLWVEEKAWMDVTFHIHKQLMQNEEVLYKSPKTLKAMLKK